MTGGEGPEGEVHVLVVDDDKAVVDVASEYLEQSDSRFSVVTETGAPAALERLEDDEAPFDCIVSDYKMPEMDGLEFLERVQDTCEDVPFVLFTSQWQDLFEEARPDGVADLVRKDVREGSYAKLVDSISRVADAEAT